MVGVLTRADLATGLTEKGGDAVVGASMTPRFETADPSEMVEAVFQRLQASPCPAAPVLEGDKLVGVLTLDNLGQVLAIQSARHPDGAQHARGR